MSKVVAIQDAKSECLGALLAAARKERGLPVEQVAHDTRIRVARLLEIENDDLSHFAHPSYARMFLLDYAKYLGISAQKIRNLLPERGECGSEGYQYLREMPVTEYPVSRTEPARRRFLPALARAAMFMFVLVGMFYAWTTYRNIDRLGLNRVLNTDERIASTTTPTAPEVAVDSQESALSGSTSEESTALKFTPASLDSSHSDAKASSGLEDLKEPISLIVAPQSQSESVLKIEQATLLSNGILAPSDSVR